MGRIIAVANQKGGVGRPLLLSIWQRVWLKKRKRCWQLI